jgi:hypothetical protein
MTFDHSKTVFVEITSALVLLPLVIWIWFSSDLSLSKKHCIRTGMGVKCQESWATRSLRGRVTSWTYERVPSISHYPLAEAAREPHQRPLSSPKLSIAQSQDSLDTWRSIAVGTITI